MEIQSVFVHEYSRYRNGKKEYVNAHYRAKWGSKKTYLA